MVSPATNVDHDKLPKSLVWFVIAVSILPFLLNLIGFDFGSAKVAFDPVLGTVDNRFESLGGAFTHALLEWAAFSLAIITCVIAFTNYFIKGDVAVPVIGVALLCAGFMDAFHTLAATRLIDAVAPNKDLIPF